MSQPVDEFEPPYYAVIFSNRLDLESDDGYGDMAERMVELAEGQQGFLGVDSARNPDGFGITVSINEFWFEGVIINNHRDEFLCTPHP